MIFETKRYGGITVRLQESLPMDEMLEWLFG